MTQKSLLRDQFVIDRLPPREAWPQLTELRTDGKAYPETLNCAQELLDRAVEDGDGERPAVFFEGECWTYRRVMEESNRLANFLVGEGEAVPGNRVLIRGPNHPWYIVGWLACSKAGLIAVSTMPVLRAREVSQILEVAEPDLAICHSAVAGELLEGISRVARKPRHVFYFGGPGPAGERPLEDRVASMSSAFSNATTAATDPAIIAFTSGTTGKPKGSVHFHRDLLAVCDTYAKHVLRAHKDDVFCGTPSLAFTYGLGGLLLFPFRARACVALQARNDDLLPTMQAAGATTLFTSPAMYRVLADVIGRYRIPGLRRCVSAGEALPQAVYAHWRERTGLAIIDGIGATEMLHIFISSTDAQIRPGATGVVVPGYEARVVDETGKPVRAGEVGRLAVRGPTGCRYLNDPESQARYVQGGWNITGDAYRLDADGYFHYYSRLDDIIITDGNNVAPAEIEGVLLRHPAVKECVVVAVPDLRRGTQSIKAFIVLHDGAATLELQRNIQAFLKRDLSSFKLPREIEFIAALPRTSTGKVQRFQLRELGSASA